MIGTALTKALIENKHSVIILSRNKREPQEAIKYAQWNLDAGTIDANAIAEADAIIHLAGANVADGRWTNKRKKEIRDSRVKSGQLLVKALREIPNKVQTVISASAIGWYGADGTTAIPFTEEDGVATDFLGQTSQQWESAITPVGTLGKRLIILRIGIVLSNNGGAYAEFKKPLRFGMASVLGSGKQVVSWIHIIDLVNLFIYGLETENINGVYNAVAPQPATNEALIKEIAKARGGSFITAHVPQIALKLALGEMSVEVLKSTTVSSKKIETAGYNFQFPDVETAVADLENNFYKL